MCPSTILWFWITCPSDLLCHYCIKRVCFLPTVFRQEISLNSRKTLHMPSSLLLRPSSSSSSSSPSPLPYLKRNPYRIVCRLYIEKKTLRVGRTVSFWITGIQVPPISLPSCELLRNKTPRYTCSCFHFIHLRFTRERLSELRFIIADRWDKSVKSVAKDESLFNNTSSKKRKRDSYLLWFVNWFHALP